MRAASSSIGFLADSGSPTLESLCEVLRNQDPDAVVFAGDIGLDDFSGFRQRRAAKRWRSAWGDGLWNVLAAVPGNHDYISSDAHPLDTWRRTLSGAGEHLKASAFGACFCLELPHILVTGLDTGRHIDVPPAESLAWLESRLAGCEAPWRVAVLHAPPFPVSLHRGNSLDRNIEARDALVARLQQLGVSLVVSGHEHLYARQTLLGPPPMTFLTTGGGGAPLYPVRQEGTDVVVARHHLVVLSATYDSLIGTAIATDASLIDRFRLTRA